ncbi:hypothetical protein SK3146_06190 [Paenibacillus konkukensis]|uniref:DUF4367 domain-containing protein n=1 Tax=Paenibacillus konkukensis TaxID=2020716 RepID=A0ABY4RXM1_9BACL|nr:hypothetical protein [Paenibacillus konkukensis]UQZ86897.1 hypothetical protein SK3146_06190 [Paenibacillus konkukensis]
MNKSDFDAEFDRLLEEAVRQSENDIVVPDAGPSWTRMEKRLVRERRRARWMRGARWFSLAAASLLAGAFLFHSLQTTEAFRPMFEMAYKMKGGTVSMQIGSTDRPSAEGAKTPPPPDDWEEPYVDNRDLPQEGAFRRMTVTLEAAKEQMQFELPSLDAIPGDLTLQAATLHFSGGEAKASALKLVYADKGETPALTVLLRKRAFSAHAEDPDGQRFVTELPDGTADIEVNRGELNMIVRGSLKPEELGRIADGLLAKP